MQLKTILESEVAACAQTTTIEKIRDSDCFRVLDTDQKSAHYFQRRPPVRSKAFAVHQMG